MTRDRRLTCALRVQIVNSVTKMQGLQRGQRVQFEKKHIVSIKCGAAPSSRHSLPCLQLPAGAKAWEACALSLHLVINTEWHMVHAPAL